VWHCLSPSEGSVVSQRNDTAFEDSGRATPSRMAEP
jgi:hypothetical protein